MCADDLMGRADSTLRRRKAEQAGEVTAKRLELIHSFGCHLPLHCTSRDGEQLKLESPKGCRVAASENGVAGERQQDSNTFPSATV